MAGFTTSNNNIKVTENVTVGSTTVEETVMDTGSDMPHIVGTAYLANQTVDFSNMGQTQNYAGIDYCSSNTCIGYEWVYVYNPGFYSYQLTYVPGSWDFTYNWYYSSYERVYTSGFYTYELVWNPGTYSREFNVVFDACCWSDYYQYTINSRESSSTVNIADLTTDEDGNAIDIDFIIVQATGSRTLAGSDPRFSQTFVTGVAPKTFSFQGSVLLEAAAETNGNSWMRRIMSVFVNNSTGKLQLQKKESIRSITRSSYDSAFATGSTRSTFSFNLKVFFGRFK